MHIMIKKTLVVVVVAGLLLSIFIIPNSSSAVEKSSPQSNSTWQTDPSVLRSYNGLTGALNYVSFPPNVRQQYALQAANQTDVRKNLNSFAVEFSLGDVQQDLKFVDKRLAPSGATSYRYQQVIDGVPVFGGQLILNYDQQGYLAAISGETLSQNNVVTTPHIDASTAVLQAMRYVAAYEEVPMSSLVTSKPELWIYDPSLVTYYSDPVTLVWKIEVTTLQTSHIRYVVLMNAHLNNIALMFNQTDTIWTGNGQTLSTPASLPPNPITSSAWLPNFNATAITYDSNNTSGRGGTGGSTLVCTTTQPTVVPLFGIGSCDGTASPASDANAAHYWALSTHDYYDLYFGRNSIDDAGMDLISNVRFTPNGSPYQNAFWDGTQMTYGNDGFWAADDVVGHELTHGVTENMSGLVYYYESGAINESLSDVFGEAFDMLNGLTSRTADPDGIAVGFDPSAWKIGEEIQIGAIRDMANPPTYNHPDRMLASQYYKPTGDDWALDGDNGGVHLNSGVANKAFWLMAVGSTFNGYTITPMSSNLEDSIELSLQIWYEVQFLLSNSSDYGVLDQALVTACNNLVGQAFPGTTAMLDASDCAEVSEATDATEMHMEPAVDYVQRTTPICTNGTDIQTDIFNVDFENGTMAGMTPQILSGAGTSLIEIFSFWDWSLNGLKSLYVEDSYNVDHAARMTSSVDLSGGTEYWLYFNHVFGLLDIFDVPSSGAVLEYSIDGGSNWFDAGAFYSAGQGYNTIGNGTYTGSTRLSNQLMFGFDSHGWASTRYNLTPLAGQTVMFRWRVINFSIWGGLFGPIQDVGWLIDDIRIYGCQSSGTPNTATNTPITPTNTPTNTPITPTLTPSNTPITPTDTPSNTPITPTDTPTNTPITPTNTPTNTPITPTDTPSNTPITPTNTPTNTPITPTLTPSNTPITPTNTNTPVTPTNTPITPTNTPVTPTNTPVTPTNTPVTPTLTPTGPTATNTSTPCVISVTAPTLQSPSHRTHTTDTTPKFTWSAVANAQSYRLMVYLEDRSFVYKKRTFNTTYTLTEAEALIPDQYLWRVRTQDKTCSTWSSWSKRNTLFIDATGIQPTWVEVLQGLFK